MAVLDIVIWPAPVLETKTQLVTDFSEEFQVFVQNMFETMEKETGIGLAANQVGDLRRVCVLHIPQYRTRKEDGTIIEEEEKKWWHDKKMAFVNPQIIKKSGSHRGTEGCLSFPDVYEWVDRSDLITVKAFNEKGEPFEIEADGLLSVCLQHEIDHLDGIVFINRMSRLKASMIRKKMQKRVPFQK